MEPEYIRGRLAELYSPSFTLILQLRGTSQLTDADSVREGLLKVLNECEVQALRSHSRQDVDDAKFALVAFIDETVLSSDWPMKGTWMSNPLQLQLYNRFDAGEQFFERLNGLLQNAASRIEVLEVYYLCLTLGFKGRYQLVEQDRLRSLIGTTRSALNQVSELRAGVLSPNGRPHDQLATEVKSKLPAWAIVATTFLVGLLIYIAMSIYISGKAGSVKKEIEALTGISAVSPTSAVAYSPLNPAVNHA